MKRILTTMLVFLLCVTMIACSGEEPSIDTNDEVMLNNETLDSNISMDYFPDVSNNYSSDSSSFEYEFSSFEEMADIKSVLTMDDADAGKYISEKRMDEFNVTSKNDAATLINKIESFEILYLDPAYGYELNKIEFCADFEWAQYIYAKDGYGYLRIWTYIDKEYTKSTQQSVETLKIGDETVELYSYNNEKMRYGLYGDLITDNYRIRVSANESVDFDRIGDYLTVTPPLPS